MQKEEHQSTKAKRFCSREPAVWCPWNLLSDGQPEIWSYIVVSDGEIVALARDNIIPRENVKYWVSIHHLPLLRDGCDCG